MQTSELFLEDVERVDSAIVTPSGNVEGRTYTLDLRVAGPLDDNGFICDFGKLKSGLRAVIKERLDHKLLLPEGRGLPEPWEYQAPRNATETLPFARITPENLGRYCSQYLEDLLGLESVNVLFKPIERGAGFFYTHGIAGHEGACQRLFHGHYCQIRLFVDGDQRPELETWLVRQVIGGAVHIACASQCQDSDAPKLGFAAERQGTFTISYQGSEGSFRGVVPRERTFFVPDHTSIESIGTGLLMVVTEKVPSFTTIEIECREGFAKGVRCRATR